MGELLKDGAAQSLAVAARASLSAYCSSECKAHCCRKGHLLLSAKEVGLIHGLTCGDCRTLPERHDHPQKEFVFNLGSHAGGCPNLVDFKCSIHTDPARPKACQEFPLFLWKEKTVMVTYACDAVRQNKLYPFLAEFKRMGYRLVYMESKD